jgi:hypothetical protein
MRGLVNENLIQPKVIVDTSKMTVERLELTCKRLAKIISLYGDYYLPLFERVHKELVALKKSEDLLSIALSYVDN